MQRIDINLRQSFQFKLLLSLAALGSLIIVFSLPTHWLIKLFLANAVIFYYLYIFYTSCLLKGKHAIGQISFNEDGWHIFCHDEMLVVDLCGESTVTNWVSVLRFKLPHKRQKYTSVIFKDAINADDYRRLIVLLRTARAFQAERIRKLRTD